MTDRLYYDDSSLLEFEASITAVRRDDERFVTTLNRSAFYPTSGGQQHDTGRLNGVPVTGVIELDEGRVGHITDRPAGSPGEVIHGQVDAARRLRHCRQHTAQHILSQTFLTLFGHETLSVHLGEEYGAIELDVRRIEDEEIVKAEIRANQIVFENRPVTVGWFNRSEAEELPLRKLPVDRESIRVVNVDGFDWSACGGTHCRSTAEVGLVKLVGRELMRGHVLVKFLSGDQCLRDYAERHRVTDELSRRLTCRVAELPDKVATLDSQVRNLRRELSVAWRNLLPARAEAAVQNSKAGPPGTGVCVIEEQVPDVKLAGELVGMVADRVKAITIMVWGDRLLLAVPSDSDLHAGDLARRLGEGAGLRGGGSARLAQLGGFDRDNLRQYCRAVEQILSDA